MGENRAVDERSGLSDAEVVDALTSDSTIGSAVFSVSSLADPGGRIRFKAELLRRPVSAADGVDGQGALQARR